MTGNPYESPDDVSGTQEPRKRAKFSLIRVLTVAGIIMLLFALVIPARRGARPAARRMQCANNLKHIALALHTYESTYQALPPAYTVGQDGNRLHSWRTLILPFIDQEQLYQEIDLSKPWNDPANLDACGTQLAVFCCPATRQPRNETAYLAVVCSNGCFRPTAPRPLSEITDDREATLMVIEVGADEAVPWAAPQDADERMILGLGSNSQLPHVGGTQAAFADGSIRFLSSALTVAERRAMISIAGNDDETIVE